MALTSTSRSELPIRVLDLFSGAGGLSAGLSEASHHFVTIRAVEFDRAAAATYAQNHASGTVYSGPIEDWLRSEVVPPSDIVVGGPPCQGFSTLGKQDAEDDRNMLWQSYAQTIRESRPQYFVLENVPAFLSSIQYEQFKNQTSPDGPLRDYAFDARILNAADFGAAQVRKRVVVIGHHRDLPFPGFPEPTHPRANWQTLRDALAGLTQTVSKIDLPAKQIVFAGKELPGAYKSRQLHVTRRYEQISLDRFKHIPAGGNRFDIPDVLLSPCWRRHTSGSGDVMGRLSWLKPSVTIRTEFFKPEKGRYLHPTQDRALTLYEATRIQGFPDDYKWVGSKTSIARQIGNAVPIPLGRAIGAQLLKSGF